MQRVVLGVLAGLVACALVWGLVGDGENAPLATPDSVDPNTEDTTSGPSSSGGPGLHGAVAPAGGAAVQTGTAPAPASPYPPGFEPAPGVVRGVVRAPVGQSASGLTVHLDGLQKPRTLRTDAEGRFGFKGIPAHHSVRVWAAEGGLVPAGAKFGAHLRVEPGHTHDVEIHLVEGLTTHGRVVRWDGTPVPDARVWVVVTNGSTVPRAYLERLVAKSAADGGFRIKALPRSVSASWIEVRASAPRLPDGSARLVNTILEMGQAERKPEDPIEIVLGEPCFVDVRVVDEDTGQGVPDAVVRKGAYGRIEIARTGADGRCRVGPVPPGPRAWTVHAKRWGAAYGKDVVRVEAVPGYVPAVTHTLFRVYDIQGRVVYADGKPADDRGYGLAVKGPNYGMSTDISGTFHIRHVPKGTYEVAISSRAMHGASVDATDGSVLGRAFLEAGTTDAVIVLKGKRPADLEIVARDGDGALLSLAAVMVGCDDEEWRMQNVWQPRALSDGRAHLSGIVHPVWLEVLAAPGTPWAPRRVGPIAPGTPRVEVRLEKGLSLAGRVVGPDGRAVAGVDVVLDPNATEIEDKRFGRHDHGRAHTRDDGTFAFEQLWQAPYWLHVTPPKTYAPVKSKEVTAGGGEIVVRLHKRIDLALPILDAGGAPLRAAQVRLWSPPWFSDGTAIVAVSDAEGIARLRGVDPQADYSLEVTPPSTVATSRRLWRDDWRPSEDPERLPAAWVLTGVVRAAGGKPAARATVRLEYPDNRPSSATSTGTDGRFRFVQLPFEQMLLTAHAEGGLATASAMRVEASTAEVALTLHAHTGRLQVRLTPWPAPKPRAWVGQQPQTTFFLFDPAAPARRVTGAPTPAGVVSFEGLDPGIAWSLVVTREDLDLCARLDGLIPDGDPRTLRTRASRPLRGRVRAPKGTWPDKIVVLEIGREFAIDDDGAYELRGLPPGRWTLRASAHRGRSLVYRSVVVVGATAPRIDFAGAR